MQAASPFDFPIGLGTWSWGDESTWGYGKEYSEADLRQAFRTAVARGVRLFDTAEVYAGGQSERLLGMFAGELDESARKEIVVASKFMPWPWRLSGGSLNRSLKASLSRLNGQSIGLYQLHRYLPPVPFETWIHRLADAYEAGAIGNIGLSNCKADQVYRAHLILSRRGIPLASNQVLYNLLHREIEFDGTLDACKELKVSMLAYSPLSMGLLTGKYTVSSPPPGKRGKFTTASHLEQVSYLLDAMGAIGERNGNRTVTQVALRWIMSKGLIPIPGIKNSRQAADILGTLDWDFTSNDLELLDSLSSIFSKEGK
ncbi:aldo/keto reductase [Paenibacillus sp. GCM10027627]|uniref:aldo/keto reductase n=1 Tax=unclassified Paenibacillus TaxID=185978 RepID=UPI003642FDEE